MMKRYLYIFGYNTPEQIEAFDKHGFDDEDTQAVFIQADSEGEALSWGREISQEFVRRLYGDRGLNWSPGDYAHWIASEPVREYTPGILARLPVVRVGEQPPLDARRGRFAQRVIPDEIPDTNAAEPDRWSEPG